MNLRSKSNDILAKGEQDRATFQPEVDSAPLKAYRYWLKSTDREPFRENFCHFWRVVLIWAPLHWVVDHTVIPFFDSRPMRAVGRGIAWVFTKPRRWWNSLDYDTQKKTKEVLGWIGMSVFALWIAFLIVMLIVTAGPLNFLIGFAIVVGFLAVCFGIAALIEKVVRARREARQDASRKKWDETTPEEWDAYIDGLRAKNAAGKQESAFKRKVKAFFSAVGDYLVLVGNVVRVNKWKICPLVEIPDESKA